MSRGNSRSDGLAPSLFPFLAVLLCTMGALVLILMLSVAGAQSATTQILNELEEQYQLEEAKLELVKSGLSEKMAENRITLEKKRLALQAIEQHIDELLEELDQLEKQLELVDSAQEDGKKSEEQLEKEISELEKQLAEATEKLQQTLEDPNGDKPIFAIIPYDGANGTHRRPIYLECNDKGVIIQPEGVVLAPEDLNPPYGPGNPLDSALRTIRAEFPSTTGSVTNNPYPLLVVRPSGIRHYMKARAAMSGWDDQFGYELVSEDLDLAYPPGPPNLRDKIVQAVERARQRQAALIAAMPKHYEQSGYGFASAGESSGFQQGSGQGSGSGPGQGSGSESASGDYPFDEPGQPSASGLGGNTAFNGNSMFAGSSGLRDSGGAFGGSGVSNLGSPSALASAGAASEFGPEWGESNSSRPPGASGTLGAESFDSESFGSGSSSNDFGDFTSGDNASGSNTFGNNGSNRGGFSGGGSFGDESFGQGPSGASEAGLSGVAGGGGSQSSGSPSASATGASQSQGGSAQSAGSPSGAAGMSASNSAGSMSMPLGMEGAPGSPSISMQAGASSSAGSCDQNCGPGTAMPSSSMDPMSPVQPSIHANMTKPSAEMARPVAQSRGSNWAWERAPRTQTAVVRSIPMQCHLERWIVLPEKGSKAPPVIIELDGTPEQRAEKLAQAVIKRVDSWGVALAGGHWSPVLQVQVAPDADWRFEQLSRLMEGSGIGVVRKESRDPNQR